MKQNDFRYRYSFRRPVAALLAGALLALVVLLNVGPPAPATAAFPGANGQIAYMKRVDATNWEIFVMNPDGSAQTQLTFNPAGDTEPVWSPDGTQIAFISNRDGNHYIYVMNADGSDPHRLGGDHPGIEDGGPAWSPDGSRIVFDRGLTGSRELYIINVDNGDVTPLTNTAADESGADWSPDGSRIAFTRADSAAEGHRNIYVMVLDDGSAPERVTVVDGEDDDLEPSWSPDGARIAFHSARNNQGSQIYVMDADGNNVKKLTHSQTCCTSPVWSPDGTQIAIRGGAGQEFDIFVMNAAGSEPIQLTNDPAWEDSPDWQSRPDTQPTLIVAPRTGVAGTAVRLTGDNYPLTAGAATLLWDGKPIEEILILAGGAFVAPFTVPADAAPGLHTVTACATPVECAEASFEVVGRRTTTEPDFFYNGDTQVPLAIALEQIGVVAREGVSAAEIEAFVAPYGLHFIQGPEDAGSLSILGREGALTRDELVDLARVLREDGAGLFLEAGLVTTTEAVRATEAVIDSPMLYNDTFIALPAPGVSADDFAAYNQTNGVTTLMADDVIGWLLHVTDAAGIDALDMANRYAEDGPVAFALPNFIAQPQLMETRPNDTLFNDQWHHRNTGQHGGTADADIDTSWAWDITKGSSGVVIAVFDTGFDAEHPDLKPNLWVNPGETAGNGKDDDGNGYIDDAHGWNFGGCVGENAAVGCGSADVSGDVHGTAVAGVAAAAGNNGQGVSGSCPNCRIMMLSGLTIDHFTIARVFRYAATEGAGVITNSWGYLLTSPASIAAIDLASTQGRSGRGSIVLFSMPNQYVDHCDDLFTGLANVIAIGGSTNWDRKVNESAWGNCLDVIASTWRGYGPNYEDKWPYSGTLNVTTTDITGGAGYNNDPGRLPNHGQPCPLPHPTNLDYTHCFTGNSSATPLAAGVVGLLLSANPNLTRLQVQQLLQDTADKIEDSEAHYSLVNGFTVPDHGRVGHGYGRINAYEAVRVAAPRGVGGRGNVDIFVRDNRLDWGNAMAFQDGVNSATLLGRTRGFIPYWESPDIKVDSPNGGFQATPTTSAQFEALTHENPVPNQTNRVYVRVHNRGHTAADTVTVKLDYAFAGTALPPLPPDYWPRFPQNSLLSNWPLRPIGSLTLTKLAYSGASVAGTPDDAAQIAVFSFIAPPPATDPATGAEVTHLCFFAVVDSPQDPVDTASRFNLVIDQITPNDNNVTHRNVNLTDSVPMRVNRAAFYARNPYPQQIRTVLRLDAAEALVQGWTITLDGQPFDQPFTLEPGQERLLTMTVEAPERGQEADVGVQQIRLLPARTEEEEVLGGVRYHFAPLTPVEYRLFLPASIR